MRQAVDAEKGSKLDGTRVVVARSPDLWIASSRSSGKGCSKKFAKHVLLFQPDATLYCWQRNCNLRDSEPHCSTYRHETPAYAIEPIAVTKVLNDARLRVAIPGVTDAWVVQDGVELPAVPFLTNRRVILYVHGFRQGFRRVMGCVSHLNERLAGRPACPCVSGELSAEEMPSENHGMEYLSDKSHVCIVAFLWPAHVKKVAYARARAKTEKAGAELRRVVQALRSLGNEITIYGHSLGCRVALCALRDFEGSPISNLFLCAAAVPKDVLSDGGEFPRKRIGADMISVFYSARDSTLEKHFQLGERWSRWGWGCQPALGLHGPSSLEIDGLRCYDLSASVGEHSPHRYLLSECVRRCLAVACGATLFEGDLSSEGSFRDIQVETASDHDISTDTESSNSGDEEPGARAATGEGLSVAG